MNKSFGFIEKEHSDFVRILDPSVKYCMNLGYSSRMRLKWALIEMYRKPCGF